MKRTPTAVAAALVAGLVAAAPLGYRSAQSTRYRNFRVVTPGVLVRSGQMSPGGFRTRVTEYGVRTVVSLREDVRDAGPDDGKLAAVAAEADWCRANGVEHIVLTPAHWRARAGEPAPVEDNLKRFLAVVTDPAKRPVLVHCFAGIHRTGGYVALYRMESDGWTADEALAEMESMGTPRTTFDDEIPSYLHAYPRGKLAPKR